MFMGGFQKLQHILGNLEGLVHAQGCAHVQERIDKALSSHLWLTSRLCTRKKRRLEAKAKLETAFQGTEDMFQHTQSLSVKAEIQGI